MTRYFSEDPEYTQISAVDKAIRDRIIAVIAKHTQEMEGYCYFSSKPGVSEDDYEDIADDIMVEFGIKG
jgi:hypothetical protein